MHRSLSVLALAVLLSSCVTSQTTTNDGPVLVDGIPDCLGLAHWGMDAAASPDAEGAPTAQQALLEYLEPARVDFGGGIVTINETTASLVVDGRDQLVAFASEAPAGGWIVVSAEGCEGFER
ncbi:MAG: hypothetical protein OEO77_04945 [Acidimicrobiia bacterium]|nr:hypothetical protein [Acidimicrobiia bacterium]